MWMGGCKRAHQVVRSTAWPSVLAGLACSSARVGSRFTCSTSEARTHLSVNIVQVVDLKLFSPGRELPRGLLWVVEQAPGGHHPCVP